MNIIKRLDIVPIPFIEYTESYLKCNSEFYATLV